MRPIAELAGFDPDLPVVTRRTDPPSPLNGAAPHHPEPEATLAVEA